MKMIINGKMYNTDTAKRVVHHSNDYAVNDFRYFKQNLYKKKTGEFFLCQTGGPMSPAAQSYGNCMISGKRSSPCQKMKLNNGQKNTLTLTNM